MEAHGIRGCWIYWNHTLNEEAADFTMELDEEAGEFRIDMHHCPSMGRLLELKHVEPYHDYCKHCDVLYRRILEPLGYEYMTDMPQCHQARQPAGEEEAGNRRPVKFLHRAVVALQVAAGILRAIQQESVECGVV